MTSPVTIVQRVWKFLTHDLWHLTPEDLRGIYRIPVNILKALILSVKFFVRDNMSEKASALTYYTLFAVVPLMALLLAIGKGFNFQEVLQQNVRDYFPMQQELVDEIFGFANSYLQTTRTGLIMGIGIVMLLWVLISMIGNIENVLNGIWQQKKSRSALRKITDYIAIILTIPLLIILSSGTQIFIQGFLRQGDESFQFISDGLVTAIQWTPWVVTILLFTAVYMVIPNTKVRFVNALIAGAIAGIGFQVFQMLYINGQIWVSRYNAIYGSFAAVPLLLLWIQMSWTICLYGAELCYAAQNIRNYDYESDVQNISRRYADFVTVLIAAKIYASFRDTASGESGSASEDALLTTENIGNQLHLPSRLAQMCISTLAESHIICEALNAEHPGVHEWMPRKDVSTYTIGDLLRDIDENGIERFNYGYEKTFPQEWETLLQMRNAQYEAGANARLCDVQLHVQELKDETDKGQ